MAGATSRTSYSGTNLLHRFALLAQSEEEDDSPDTQDESQTLLLRDTRMDNSDTLWDHLFEDESQQTALPSALARYFAQLRGDSPEMLSIVSAKPLWLAGLHGRCSKTMATC